MRRLPGSSLSSRRAGGAQPVQPYLAEPETPVLAAYVFEPWRELAAFAILLVELSWVTPWFLLLSGDSQWGRSFGVLAATLLLAYSLARLLAALRLKLPYRIGVYALFELLAVLFSLKLLLYANQPVGVGEAVRRVIEAINGIETWIPPEFGVSLLVLILCQRAAFLAQRSMDPDLAQNSFLVGALALVFLGAITTGLHTPGLDFFPLFLVASLLAMAASRLAAINRKRGGQAIPFDRPRLAGLLGAVLVSSGLALLIGLALRSKPAFGVITFVYTLAVRLLLMLFALLMSPAMLLLTLLFPELRELRQEIPLFSWLSGLLKDLRAIIEQLPLTPLEKFLRQLSISKPLLLWLALALVLVASLAFLRLRLSRRPYQEDWLVEGLDRDERDDTLSGRVRRNLNRLVNELAARFGWGQGSRRWAAERIRRIYAELCETASHQGRPRKLSATPLEYLPELQALYPQTAGEVAAITAAYLRVRYGELPETRQEVEAIEQAWQRVKAETSTNPS